MVRRGNFAEPHHHDLHTPDVAMRTFIVCLGAMISSGLALRVPVPDTVTRRGAIRTTLFGGAAVLALPTQHALAASVFQDSDDLERRRAERLAIQTGQSKKVSDTTAYSPGVEGLIERSIANEELALGQKLSEDRKAEIAAKVRKLAPTDSGVRAQPVDARACATFRYSQLHSDAPVCSVACRRALARRRRASSTEMSPEVGQMGANIETSRVGRLRGKCIHVWRSGWSRGRRCQCRRRLRARAPRSHPIAWLTSNVRASGSRVTSKPYSAQLLAVCVQRTARAPIYCGAHYCDTPFDGFQAACLDARTLKRFPSARSPRTARHSLRRSCSDCGGCRA